MIKKPSCVRVLMTLYCDGGDQTSSGISFPFISTSDSPVSGRWKFPADPCQTARSVEHVTAVSD